MKQKIIFILIACLTFLFACKKEHVSNDICDCADSQSKYVVDTITLTIPNLFTPQADGCNDFWVIDNIDKFPDSKIKVTRPGFLGGTVYESTGSNQFWKGDSGNNKEGIKDGKYKYEITINGQTISGFVCIYRGNIKLKNQDCIKSCITSYPYDPMIN
ncbi:MAG: hypothetical protein HGB12_04765 [Bacteroidetes bacterium]|nr:hypothetical protein [Bacteroidota bacterium]